MANFNTKQTYVLDIVDNGRYDYSLPKEDDSTILVATYTTITGFDNNKVNWSGIVKPVLSNTIPLTVYKISIPSGVHSVSAFRKNNQNAAATDIAIIRYNFVAGVQYVVEVMDNGNIAIREKTLDDFQANVDILNTKENEKPGSAVQGLLC